jgi:hypothetical protein
LITLTASDQAGFTLRSGHGKVAHPTNFEYLNPAAPRTQRIIQATLAVNVPWHPEDPPVYQTSKIVQLADRIEARAEKGLTVQLRPETARVIALTLRLYAAGHGSLSKTHPHHVEDWSQEVPEILAYCTSATLANGAWETYAPQYPQRKVIATWGGWITRGSKRA